MGGDEFIKSETINCLLFNERENQENLNRYYLNSKLNVTFQ